MTDQDRPPNGMEKLNEHGVFVASALAFDWMGLSVRDPEWRFTLWLEWDGVALAPLWEREVGAELYSHTGDGGLGASMFDDFENRNLASAAANPQPTAAQLDAMARLRAVLKAHQQRWSA